MIDKELKAFDEKEIESEMIIETLKQMDKKFELLMKENIRKLNQWKCWLKIPT